MIHRLFVEKKKEHAVAAAGIKGDIEKSLGIKLDNVREFLRYDVEGLTGEQLAQTKSVIFSEPMVDLLYNELPVLEKGTEIFAIEFLPGQYDQRADSCVQCVQLLLKCKRPIVRCARVLALTGKLKKGELQKIKAFLINPVECREASLEKPASLALELGAIAAPYQIDGFKDFNNQQIADFHKSFGFAMNIEDLCFVRDYFAAENRNPFETELKILDTYWSDHCRHTTFMTELTKVDFAGDANHPVIASYKKYQQIRERLYKGRTDKPECFMDIATIAVKKLKADGGLKALDESEEINACSVNVDIEVDGKKQPYLVMFKNETHNHPTEIEPYGGAATCLGGAIRDPLSGRSFVYQAMRVTGAPNPNADPALTLEGKLKRAVITKTAAKGFSSYGNQIGLATGIVHEVYHEGYEAKRLETGFVIGAAPKGNVIREVPKAGDVVILLGGETGRDGCGGAVGSSKAHDTDSISTCGAEVQKGNPLVERKIQRLFRNEKCTKLIKRCNDFGAGGVCVAVGEIADSIDINLNAIPKKYEGLSATELAISESQERMAVVVRAKDVEKFIALADEENLDATVIATVTDSGKMRMIFNGQTVAELKRDMLNSAGIRAKQSVLVNEQKSNFFNNIEPVAKAAFTKGDYAAALKNVLASLAVCSQKGLIEHFDSSIGAGSVTVPLGGINQLTPSSVMAGLIPTGGESSLASVCSFAYDADLSSESPYLGAMYAVTNSVIKLALAGVELSTIHLTFQEYFKRLNKDDTRWGVPMASLLGALQAQLGLGLAAIGGKDSMSGTFEKLDVPPTLISFAVGTTDASNIVTNVFEKTGESVYRIALPRDEYGIPNFEKLKELLTIINKDIKSKNITYASIIERGGAAATIIKSCFGNNLGFSFKNLNREFFTPAFGDILVSASCMGNFVNFSPEFIGIVTDKPAFEFNKESVDSEELKGAFVGTLEEVFPTKAADSAKCKVQSAECMANVATNALGRHNNSDNQTPLNKNNNSALCTLNSALKKKTKTPIVLIPTFPGTNCEYDTARAFEKAGAKAEIFIIKNRTEADINNAIAGLEKAIKKCHIVAFPGGFSGGDEPDGSAKFICSIFRSPTIAAAIKEHIEVKKGLILGICNGFQALVKLGLLPYGAIKEMSETDATLTFNTIGRHIANIVKIKVAKNASPWLKHVNANEEYLVPISHGEGRFVCSEEDLQKLIAHNQIATQYVGENPNGSTLTIEGITSPCGQIFGKMGHSERIGKHLYKNVIGEYDMQIFRAGVEYFTK